MLFASTVINYIDRQTLSLLAPVIGMFLVLLLLRNNEATEQGLVRRL